MAPTPALREVFLSRWPPSEGTPPGPELDRALETAMTQAVSACPEIEPAAEDFVAYLAERTETTEPSPVAAILGMNIGDLALCFGSQRGAPSALAALDRLIQQQIGAIRRIDASPSFVDEIQQVMRVKLLVGTEEPGGERFPKILQYRGKAPLRTWLRVVATRVGIEVVGRSGRESGGLDDLIAVAAAEDPELAHLRARHLGEFRSAVNQAVTEMLAGLTPESRNLLRWHLVENLSLRKIALVRGETVSAVSRQYARIRAGILDRVRQRLKEQTGLPSKDLDSVMAALRSQISLSSCAILRKAS